MYRKKVEYLIIKNWRERLAHELFVNKFRPYISHGTNFLNTIYLFFLTTHIKTILHCRRLIRNAFFLIVRAVFSIHVIKDIFKRFELKNNILLYSKLILINSTTSNKSISGLG